MKQLYLLCFILASTAAQADSNSIYLVGNFNIRGTPLSEAVLLQDVRIQGIEQCWEFVQHHVRGKSRGRNYFRHYIRTQKKGVNIQTHYTCIDSGLTISRWDPQAFYTHTYLIDLRKGVSFTETANMNSCWAILNKQGMLQKDTKLFCAKMSQTVQ